MTTYKRRVQLPVTASDAFRWHERPGAIDRLIPPWEPVSVLKRGDGIRDGSRVVLQNRLGPIRLNWIADHSGYVAGQQFQDEQTRGPFKRWIHTHRFEGSAQGVFLEDEIEYELPGGPLGRLLGSSFVAGKIDRMFKYRHEVTLRDLLAHARFSERGIMKFAITGSSGLVGQQLVPFLTTGGHEVTRITRRASEDSVVWDPSGDSFDATPLEGLQGVVHLAGENIAEGRWNDAKKKRILESRSHGTRVLCEGLAKMERPPEVLVSASAIGIYGDRGDELLDEESATGSGFLADVCQAWEEATQPARDAGIRVVNLRIGVVLSPQGGALGKMLFPFKMGGGGVLGSGKQYMSWIAIDDLIGAIHHALMTETLRGPVNAVSPNPVTNREFTKTLGQVLRRPTIVPMPGFAARLAFGEMAQELLLSGARVQPKRLQETGFEYRLPNLEDALRHLLGK